MTTAVTSYPVRFDVDFPEERNRLTAALRVIWIVPIAIVIGALSNCAVGFGNSSRPYYAAAGGGGVLFLPVLLMLVFRQKYPAWWFEWNLQITRFEARVGSYFLLLRDEYPSTDEEQAVQP